MTETVVFDIIGRNATVEVPLAFVEKLVARYQATFDPSKEKNRFIITCKDGLVLGIPVLVFGTQRWQPVGLLPEVISTLPFLEPTYQLYKDYSDATIGKVYLTVEKKLTQQESKSHASS